MKLRAGLTASRLMLIVWLGMHGDAFAQQTQSAAAMEPRPPRYPPELAEAGVEGVTILLVTHGIEGNVIDVEVERSAGHPELDNAALEAARTWHMPAPPDGARIGRARVPVRFELGDGASARGPAEERPRWSEEWEAWKRMQAPAVPKAADGTLPGYLPDPLPLPAASAKDMMQWLEANARREPDQHDGARRYTRTLMMDISQYEVFDSGRYAPSVLRHRLVTDGAQAFWIQRYQCDAVPQSRCVEFETMLREQFPRQRSLPPPPPPPPPPEPAG